MPELVAVSFSEIIGSTGNNQVTGSKGSGLNKVARSTVIGIRDMLTNAVAEPQVQLETR